MNYRGFRPKNLPLGPASKHPYFRNDFFESPASCIRRRTGIASEAWRSPIIWDYHGPSAFVMTHPLAGENSWADESACLIVSLSRK